MSKLRICAALLLLAGVHPALGITIYTGSLSTTGASVMGVGAWVTPGPTTMSWEVTDLGTHFHYKYTLATPGPSVSHFIVEVSPTFGYDNFSNAVGPFSVAQIGDYSQLNGNPNIPGLLHGLKFDEVTGHTVTFEFDSVRRPVWGDFYAKCGGNPANQVWNEGFSRPDPLNPPSSGSIDNHLLVPDTLVPEPGTVALLAAGMITVARRRPALC